VTTLDEEGKLIPNPEHQVNINRQKFFEIATVIVMIFVGFGYFAISNKSISSQGNGSTTITNLEAILNSEDFEQLDSSTVLNHTFRNYTKKDAILQTLINLISIEGSDQTNAVIFTASLPSGTPLPPSDVLDKTVQNTFDEIARIGELLIPVSSQGLSKAVSTTIPVSNPNAQFLKGVAQTNSGWKITYIAYSMHTKSEEDTPLLLFIYQHLDAASDPALESFNQVMFSAANDGYNILQAMHDYSEEGSLDD